MHTFKIFVSIFEIFFRLFKHSNDSSNPSEEVLLQTAPDDNFGHFWKPNNSPEISLVVQHRSYWETAAVRGFDWGCWSRCAFLPSDNQASQ